MSTAIKVWNLEFIIFFEASAFAIWDWRLRLSFEFLIALMTAMLFILCSFN